MLQDDEDDRSNMVAAERGVRPVEGRLQLPRFLAVIGALAAIAGVGITATYYFLTYSKTSAKIDHDEEVRLAKARIYFELKMTKEWCKAEKDGTYSQCDAKVVSTDTSKRILNFGVQLPSSIDPRNQMRGSFGGGAIEFGPFNLALTARTFASFGLGRAGAVQSLLPIIIYSTYEYDGEQYKDRSLYYIYYQTFGTAKQAFSAPIGMAYCGRLKEDEPPVDFLLDPWARSPMGSQRGASIGIMFNCPAKYAFWFSLPPGRGFVETDVSPGQKNAPKPIAKSYPMSFNEFLVTPVDSPLKITYWMSNLDDPSLPQIPQIR